MVSYIKIKFREKILKKIFDKHRRMENLPQEINELVTKLMEEVDYQWISWHKRHKVLDEMEDPENHQIYRKSKIPIKSHTWKLKKQDNIIPAGMIDRRAKFNTTQTVNNFSLRFLKIWEISLFEFLSS